MTTNRNNPMTNWRMLVIVTLSIIGVILLMGDTDDVTTLIVIKLIAFALIYVVFQLSRLWKDYLSNADEEER